EGLGDAREIAGDRPAGQLHAVEAHEAMDQHDRRTHLRTSHGVGLLPILPGCRPGSLLLYEMNPAGGPAGVICNLPGSPPCTTSLNGTSAAAPACCTTAGSAWG